MLNSIQFKNIVIIGLFIISLFLFGCSSDSDDGNTDTPTDTPKAQNESITQATQYFPLSLGNTWQYFVTVTESNGSTYTEYTYIVVSKTTTFNNSDVYNVKNDINAPNLENENFLYSKWDDGIYDHGVTDPDTDNTGISAVLSYLPPVKLLPSTFDVGNTWDESTTLDYKENGQTVENFTTTFHFTVEAKETVTVPAGTFQDAYKISIQVRGSVADSDEDIVLWLAEGVGIVKKTSTGGSQSFTKELQYAAVNGNSYGNEM